MFIEILVGSVVVYFSICLALSRIKVGNFNQKRVVITGCDSGFGRALAIQLDSLGFHVFAACFTEAGEKDLKETTSSRLSTFRLDVTKEAEVKAAVEFVKNKLPPGEGVWGLVNNAGIASMPLETEILPMDEFYKVMNVNTFGPVLLTRAFMPLLRKTKGRIVNTSSLAGKVAWIFGPYAMSKFALEAYSDVLRREIFVQGIKVSVVEPGVFFTNISKNFKEDTLACLKRNGIDDPEILKVYGVESKDVLPANKENFVSALSKGTTAKPNLQPVVDAYLHALTARFPSTRYTPGFDSKIFTKVLAHLPDWIVDYYL